MDRLTTYFRQLVHKAVANLPYAGQYEYSVESCDKDAQTLDARSLSASMPNLTSVPMASPGLILDVPRGTTVKIGFAALDPTRPFVASYGSGGTSAVENEVFMGWLGLLQAPPPASTLTVVYQPSSTLPPPTPEAPPGIPTPLTPSPVYFRINGGRVTGDAL